MLNRDARSTATSVWSFIADLSAISSLLWHLSGILGLSSTLLASISGVQLDVLSLTLQLRHDGRFRLLCPAT